MAHFAEIDKDGKVLRVIVAEQDFIDSGAVGDPLNWVQTSYNTSGGKYLRGTTEDERLALKQEGSSEDVAARERKNFAGVGFTYDKARNAFIPPKPFDSWTLDEGTCQWEPPTKMPEIGNWRWNEELKTWEPAPDEMK